MSLAPAREAGFSLPEAIAALLVLSLTLTQVPALIALLAACWGRRRRARRRPRNSSRKQGRRARHPRSPELRAIGNQSRMKLNGLSHSTKASSIIEPASSTS